MKKEKKEKSTTCNGCKRRMFGHCFVKQDTGRGFIAGGISEKQCIADGRRKYIKRGFFDFFCG